MAEIINIPDFGEVKLSLKEYNEMRDRIKDLEEQNDTLTQILDNVCDENKVRVRRQIIKVTELTTNPRALGQQEIIEDKLINMEDVTSELDEKIAEVERGWKQEAQNMEDQLEQSEKTLEACQRQKIDLEQEVFRLKNRPLWDRLWNK
jgi:predicted secreted protein